MKNIFYNNLVGVDLEGRECTVSVGYLLGNTVIYVLFDKNILI